MSVCVLILFLMFQAYTIYATKKGCEDINCSNVFDPVCGEATALSGNRVVKTFHNVCYFRLIQCRFQDADLQLISDDRCNIKNFNTVHVSVRRLNDFSIVGAHQACNHTCPTFCLDTYDPACAQIWAPNMQSYVYRPMINHCHIDLYSCVAGVNVTIQPLIGKCYKNPSAINFMFNVASLKTLKLLDEPSKDITRRANVNQIIRKEVKDFLQVIENRVEIINKNV